MAATQSIHRSPFLVSRALQWTKGRTKLPNWDNELFAPKHICPQATGVLTSNCRFGCLCGKENSGDWTRAVDSNAKTACFCPLLKRLAWPVSAVPWPSSNHCIGAQSKPRRHYRLGSCMPRFRMIRLRASVSPVDPRDPGRPPPDPFLLCVLIVAIALWRGFCPVLDPPGVQFDRGG